MMCTELEQSRSDMHVHCAQCEVFMLRWLWGAVAQLVRAQAAKAGGTWFDSQRLPWAFFFFFSAGLYWDEGSVVL